MTEFTVRDARPEDYPAIAALNTKAFDRPDEAAIAQRLRAEGDVMMEIVAEADGQIIGHALFYQLRVYGKLAAIGLGPMCVDPWIQREGIGKGMLNHSLAYLQQQGVSIVFVLGHPDYYSKFGFNVAATADFQSPFKDNPAFMAVRMRYGPPMSGRLLFPDAFGIES
jgi:putative acetyltransferase